ncbi:hypothetical protein MUY27_17610 [Mucilaginibacter sp. RS28]|uniref:Uncharacterized protein n=1 Tax=Mucilaginibacter straminoryzae TaxID=2932774 RepID=A0A9X1X5V4_9SPHI|nr:hypothetical protein [Mucilaginibacter straminoryzae]MCJ8211541.1 hypothetical protein [Mucilaginibacter straminoryzae]
MEKNRYLKSKAKNKKTAMTGVWLIILAIALFAFIVVKYARNTAEHIGESRMPEKEDAYEVAKEFVKEDSRSKNLDFGDDGFSYAKTGDSVFVVRSAYTENIGNGESKKTNFSVTIRYHGGSADSRSSWDLLNINLE